MKRRQNLREQKQDTKKMLTMKRLQSDLLQRQYADVFEAIKEGKEEEQKLPEVKEVEGKESASTKHLTRLEKQRRAENADKEKCDDATFIVTKEKSKVEEVVKS